MSSGGKIHEWWYKNEGKRKKFSALKGRGRGEAWGVWGGVGPYSGKREKRRGYLSLGQVKRTGTEPRGGESGPQVLVRTNIVKTNLGRLSNAGVDARVRRSIARGRGITKVLFDATGVMAAEDDGGTTRDGR